ncbi:MAG: HEAT repeat domain-containing protein [Nitrospira sp.]|nr:HEAT repeat domain-containing protein [Nitrospira sp.]MBH0188300.1 HEAT repeat domain-containing protein [Nitrospira sp.]MBH0195549.1 HEAT repeat domain-containing protein [Nitrospira sp.]
MANHREQGQVYPTAIVILVGLIVAAVWIWKRLPAETQDYAIDQALPVAAGGVAVAAMILAMIVKIRRRAATRRERNRLIGAFQRETAQDKKLDLSFALIECNAYRLDGLEEIAPALKDIWVMTLGQAVEDKQHRIRGMAASHLGVLRDQSVAPLLVKALKDDHAYVRACAALGLGRLRATDARDRLAQVAEEDGDQTVRGRAREALEQMRN